MPGGSPVAVVEALSNRLDNLPGLTLCVRRTERVADETTARVEVVAPGTGDALASSGTGTPLAPAGKALVATRQVTLGFLRPNGTFYLVWHIPEGTYSQTKPDIDATLASVRFTASGQTPSYSE
jgi:hypothetical protein